MQRSGLFKRKMNAKKDAALICLDGLIELNIFFHDPFRVSKAVYTTGDGDANGNVVTRTESTLIVWFTTWSINLPYQIWDPLDIIIYIPHILISRFSHHCLPCLIVLHFRWFFKLSVSLFQVSFYFLVHFSLICLVLIDWLCSKSYFNLCFTTK